MLISFITRLLRNFPLTACIVLLSVKAWAGPGAEDSTLFLGNLSSLTAPYPYTPDPSIRYDGYGIRAGLLYDVETKKIVWQKEMNKAFPIASLTKMMVA